MAQFLLKFFLIGPKNVKIMFADFGVIKPNVPTEVNLLLVGSGDTPESFEFLFEEFPENTIGIWFSGRSRLQDYKGSTLNSEVRDVDFVLNWLKENGTEKVNIIATSRGAAAAMANAHNPILSKLLFIDPADYLTYGEAKTWDGSMEFDPVIRDLYSYNLRRLPEHGKVTVIYFPLKTFVPGKPLDYSHPDMATNREGGFPRLSEDMAVNIWEQVPWQNRATKDMIIADDIPHAITKGGDVEKNKERFIDWVRKYIIG